MFYNVKNNVKTILKGKTYEIDNNSDIFPPILKEIQDSPKKLYMIGNLGALNEGLGVVGTRQATPYGLSASKHFSFLAAEKGITIISGGAYGCDSAAHKGALDAKGLTLVFLGGGCNHIYPSRNLNLFQKIIDNNGCIVSELSWEAKALPYTFIKRNRLIAALSKAILITEASMPSGAFSTVDFALKFNKEVLAVPGAITSEKSLGCNKLILEGALPVIDDDTFNNYLFSFFSCLKNSKYSQSSNKEIDKLKCNPIIKAILAQPTSYDTLLNLAYDYYRKKDIVIYLSRLLAKAETKKIIRKYNNGIYAACVN